MDAEEKRVKARLLCKAERGECLLLPHALTKREKKLMAVNTMFTVSLIGGFLLKSE